MAADAPPKPEKCFPISLEQLEPGSVLPCNIWMKRGEDRIVLYRSRNLSLEESHLRRLREAGVEQLLIGFDDAQHWSDYVGSRVQRLAADGSQPIESRLRSVIEISAQTMRQVFEDPRAPHAYQSVRHVGSAISHLMQQPGALGPAVRLMSHDYYTYTHSMQVSMYAVALAQACGESHPERLRSIGLGCLMHDVGKCDLPREVLNKPGRLDAREWDMIRRHPDNGVGILRGQGCDDPLVLEIVAHHHERLDGSGYPHRLAGRRIGFVARVAAICDAFDAMTTDRSYARAKRGAEALQIIRNEGSRAYDQRIVDRFIHCLLQPETAAPAEA